jgi:phosphatidylinositol glycan class C protein
MDAPPRPAASRPPSTCPCCGGARCVQAGAPSSSSTFFAPAAQTVPLSAAPPPGFHTTGSRLGARWQKVLYVRQPYADNHVDDTFLASLVTNANVQPYDFWAMVRATAVVLQQVSVSALFFLTYGFVHRGAISITAVIMLDVVASIGLVVAQRLAGPKFHTAGLLPDMTHILRYSAIFLAVLFGLSPILQTLTQAYCNDTIWALTILLSTIHIVTHQYHSTATGLGAEFPGTVSLNAAIFAAVLLASRLPSTTHVFVFLVLAIQLFALFPIMRDYIRVRSEYTHLWVAALLCTLTLALLLATSTLLAVLYLGGTAFIAFVCPYWLMSAQKYKNEIQGPWDIATVAQFST